MRPRVFFDKNVQFFHPLVKSNSNELRLNLEWQENRNWLVDVLLYVKKAFHLKEMFDLDKNQAWNSEALNLFKSDYPAFVDKCQDVARQTLSHKLSPLVVSDNPLPELGTVCFSEESNT